MECGLYFPATSQSSHRIQPAFAVDSFVVRNAIRCLYFLARQNPGQNNFELWIIRIERWARRGPARPPHAQTVNRRRWRRLVGRCPVVVRPGQLSSSHRLAVSDERWGAAWRHGCGRWLMLIQSVQRHCLALRITVDDRSSRQLRQPAATMQMDHPRSRGFQMRVS